MRNRVAEGVAFDPEDTSQHTHRKVLNFENLCNGRYQKVPKIDFQCQFSISEIIHIFLNFFQLKNTSLRSHFLIFDTLLVKWCPFFDSLPLHQFSKFNNFLWICWFLGKKFVLSAWKLNNPYISSYGAYLNSQYFWKWTDANPMKIIGQDATASKLWIRSKLSLG